MIISVVNHTSGQESDDKVQTVIRAINRQIAEDFEPYWSMGATLRLEGRAGVRPDAQGAAELRGDAIIYLWDRSDVPDAIGYHERNNRGIPYGFVFLDIAAELGEPWSVTLSHEALEMIADPEVNLLVAGPHPEYPQRQVFHWYEMCDAVQNDRYEIDGVEVSNFVLPLYFTSGDETGGRNDFLGIVRPDGGMLESFGVAPGGYIGFFDPSLNDHDTYSLHGDRRAEERRRVKYRASVARRALRYQMDHSAAGRIDAADTSLTPAVEPRFEAFALRLRGSGDAGEAPAIVERILGRGWKVSAAGTGLRHLLVTRPSGALGTRDAWDLAHQLRDEPLVEHAEPLFAGSLGTWVEAPAPRAGLDRRAAGFGGDDHDPGSAAHDWSLHQVNAITAWALPLPHLQSRARGEGIVVGHPDTGYLEHPQIWSNKPSENPLLLPLGFDFVDDDPDPADPFLKEAASDSPGHGTRTASVIVSREDATDGTSVTGTAPAARLVPLRTSRSVVLLSQANLTRAIAHAVEAGCHVISISMGGLPSEALHEAIDLAEQRGVIVLAAAGNFPALLPFKPVVWPAAYEEVVAVAATNARRRPWKGSARGSAVDVSAPGESVWRAHSELKNGTLRFSIERGHGTSYAVAATAGIAALWLAYHSRDRLVDAYTEPEIPALFRWVLREHGCVAPGGWDDDDYGRGIVDAERVLTAPLPSSADWAALRAARARRARAPQTARGTAMLAYLFPDLTETERQAATAAVLGASGDDLAERMEQAGDELAFHLAFSPVLAESFRGAARPSTGAAHARAARAGGPESTRLREALIGRGASGRLLGSSRP